LLPHVIGISKVLDFDLDFDFDIASGVPLDSSQDRSLSVYGLRSYTFFVLPILTLK